MSRASLSPLEIVCRIEDIFDGQLDGADLHAALEKLQNDLLVDPTGRTRQALEYNRCADYWEKSGRPESSERATYFRKLASIEQEGTLP